MKKFISLFIWIMYGLMIHISAQVKYDFIVPDDGDVACAIRKANTRNDKDKRFYIFIRRGTYVLQGDGDTLTNVENGCEVKFPSPITRLTAPKTSIIGEGMDNTILENRPQHEGIRLTSTLYLDGADSTLIEDLQLWCNFNNDPGAFANRAVALNEKNCRGNILRRVKLRSTQDTYFTNDGGTTYLEDCHIAGTVDFICGGGTVYFNRCNLELVERGKTGGRDVITAAATPKLQDYGYVFNECRICGAESQNGRYMLGRPWRNAPRVVFLNTVMDMIPAREGWTEMHGTVPTLFAEYESRDKSGELIDLSERKTIFHDPDGGEVKVEFSPSLPENEKALYDISNVFGGWDPSIR